MNNNLLIVGAGVYGVLASEIAIDMGCFGKIAFIDDFSTTSSNGIEVIGTTHDISKLSVEYGNIIVAIGNADIRISLLKRITEETTYNIVSLISPRAYVSPTAQIMNGCIVEPMAVIHTGCTISLGCIISACAVVNHASLCCEGVHVDCNATIEGYCTVPTRTKISAGETFREKILGS